MSIQLEYATLAALGRVHKVLRTKLATVIATRPTDTDGFFADLAGVGGDVWLPTPTMRLYPSRNIPDTINEDVVAFIYHNNDRTEGDRTTGGPVYYNEVGSRLTIGCYVQVLHASGVAGPSASEPTREPPTDDGANMTSQEGSYYRAELYVGAIEYALMKWGCGGGQFYDLRRSSVEFGFESEPQPHAFGRIEFTINQDLQIPSNTFDLT